jgi:hypothetical protein
MMKNKKEFFAMLSTLLGSWGGDTPPEATWTANELVDWVEKEFGVKVESRFAEAYDEKAEEDHNDNVIEELKRVLGA